MKSNPVLSKIIRIAILTCLTVYAIAIIYPLLWMLISGFKDNADFFTDTWALPSTWYFSNYLDAWNAGVGMYFFNSVIVTATSIVLTLVLSSFMAFAISRFEFRLKNVVFGVILGGMMLSPEVSMIALYKILQDFNIYNTYWALIIPYVAFRIPFTTFLLRSYFIGLPREVEESAHIDGCGTFRIFTQIIMPISKPILATSALLAAMIFWNEFMFALVFIESTALKTIPIGLMNLRGAFTTKWTLMLAGLAISAVPMIITFLVFQKQFVRGLTSGSVKG